MPRLRGRTVVALSTAVLVAIVGLGLSACTPETGSRVGWSPVAGGNGDPGSDAVASVNNERVDAAVAALPSSIQTMMDASGVPGLPAAVVYQG